ncbi:acetyltransferase [Xylaria intraflava]|nr:acetyltransferase [Xylaria intraflava]
MSPNFNFRLATEEDAVPLERMINAAFQDDKSSHVFLTDDHSAINVTNAAGLKAKINQPDCAALAVTDASTGVIVAHCSVRKLDENRAWFGLLAVDSSYRKHGLGGRVLTWAEEYARREWASSRLEFEVVNTRAELIAWYQHRGYRTTGETSPFPYEHLEAWQGVLRDDLGFLNLGKDI